MSAPKEITYHKIAHTLTVAWADASYDLPAELLRVYSPSAEVRGHSAEERKLQTGKKNVAITACPNQVATGSPPFGPAESRARRRARNRVRWSI